MTYYKIPPSVEKAVVTKIYTQADDARWQHLQASDRTRLYQDWTEDPEIGGRLLDFVEQRANIRTWLKDCPMKEYERARRGEGKYARYVTRPAATLEQMATTTLGEDWEIVPESTRQKPLRARIRRVGSEDEEQNFVVGKSSDLKHLVWPALFDLAKKGTWHWTICVIDPFRDPVTPERKEEYGQIADFLGIQIVYFSER